MSTSSIGMSHASPYPVQVRVDPAIDGRNRLTTGFRIFLAIPHLILAGGPIAAPLTWTWSSDSQTRWEWGTGGVLGAVAAVAAVIAWFAIVFTGRCPEGLWNLGAFYMRWRVRAVAYVALLRDEYPPFGDAPYPASLELTPPDAPRDRLTVAFRPILAIPQLVAVWALGVAWGITSIIAWFAILFTGRYPEALYRFGVNVLRWSVRVEAYLLLLRDEYPPFAME